MAPGLLGTGVNSANVLHNHFTDGNEDKMPYSDMFKRKMIQKLTEPNAISAWALSKQVGVPQTTLSTRYYFFLGNTYHGCPSNFTHISASHHLMRGTAVDNPPDATTHHRAIRANTPQPKYSRV